MIQSSGSNFDTPEEQMGVIRVNDHRGTRYVPARVSHELTMPDQALLGQSLSVAGEMLSPRQMTHVARSDDSAVTQAQASLLYSLAYAIPTAVITGALMLLAWWAIGGNGLLFLLLWLFFWGVAVLFSLIINRQQGLWSSPAGLAHHEIDSRERVAMYVVDRHIDLIEKRWKLNG